MAASRHDPATIITHPRAFLESNLLCMRGTLPTAEGIYNFSFTDMTQEMQYRCSRRSKYFWRSDRSIRVWDVRIATRGGTAAFHLPYAPGQIRRAMLPDSVMLMFTAEMTGCTFGMATYPNGSIEVCHANYQDRAGALDKARLSRETAWCQTRLEDHRYRETVGGKAVPDLMRQARMGATMIGVRDLRRGWTVHAQQWECLDGSNFEYLDLITL